MVKEFTERSVMVKVCHLQGKNHVFEIKQLAEDIRPEKSQVKVKADMVVVFLAKAAEGRSWKCVSAVEKAKQAKKDEAMKPKMDDEDPSKGIMDLMRKMYDEGDDDMKRTIAKAWTESRDKQGPAGMMPGMPDL